MELRKPFGTSQGTEGVTHPIRCLPAGMGYDASDMRTNHTEELLTQRRILAFWLPLAATWLMMAVEGPFLAAIIARLTEPKFNLAAYGVAFAFAIIIESPVIMIMSAVTALAEDAPNFHRLRRFTYVLNLVITVFQVLLLVTPLFDWVARDLMNLPPEVERLTRTSLWILLPWPGAIGYRRLYQGLLIRSNMTRRVAYGTVVRLSTMGTTAFLLYRTGSLPGAWVGASALTAGVCMEALASRFMARSALRDLIEPASSERTLSYREIGRFYAPLAMTSTISLAAYPVVTFFMGHAAYSLESLAVLPVVNSLSFIFRSPALAYHDTIIALMGERSTPNWCPSPGRPPVSSPYFPPCRCCWPSKGPSWWWAARPIPSPWLRWWSSEASHFCCGRPSPSPVSPAPSARRSPISEAA